MSRKTFLIWGLVIIQLEVTLMTIMGYLAFSEIIDIGTVAPLLIPANFLFTTFGFGIILFSRIRATGRKQLLLLACFLFYVASITIASVPVSSYLYLVDFANNGLNPFVNQLLAEEGVSTWMKARIMLFIIPALYLGNWGLFALLWFGSLDPRTPSKNRAIQFFKTGFQRNSVFDVDVQPINLAAS